MIAPLCMGSDMTSTRLLQAAAYCLGLGSLACAHASGFDRMVSFGDSLSDNGNISSLLFPGGPVMRFTTNPGEVAVEHIADHYGLSLKPSSQGGTDYAWGGAESASTGSFLGLSLPSSASQIETYLTAQQGHAAPRALYTVWIGANDLFAELQSSSSTLTTRAAAAATASATGSQLATLQHAGARYVVVFNLPDLGATPAYLGSAQATQATATSQAYNQQLNQAVSHMGNGIIPVNVYALLNQVMADPARYGFGNVSQPACTTSSSILCSAATLVSPAASSNYLFADSVHPTTAAHALLAEAVLSELAAPAQISLLREAPLASIQAQNQVLSQQMLNDRFGASTRAFAAVSYTDQHFNGGSAPAGASHDSQLSLGTDARINDRFSVGLALGASQNNASLGSAGGYRLRDVSGSGYAFYHAGGGYLGAFASAGQLNFSQIDRRFNLGTASVSETGSTHGSHLGTGLQGGWIFGSGAITHGPVAGIEWDSIHVDGYRETGRDATSMWFASQQRLALISHTGWRLQGSVQAGPVRLDPMLEIDWNHDSRARPDAVTAGLDSLAGHFTLDGFAPDRNWFSGRIGLRAQFSPRLQAWLGYSGRVADRSQRMNSYDLGLKFTL